MKKFTFPLFFLAAFFLIGPIQAAPKQVDSTIEKKINRLLPYVNHKKPRIQAEAIRVLGNIRDKLPARVIRLLVNKLDSEEYKVEKALEVALEKVGSPAAPPLVEKIMKEPKLRLKGIRILEDIPITQASLATELVKLFRDSKVVYQVDDILAKMGSRAVPALLQALLSSDKDLVFRAKYTLGEIGKEALPLIKKKLEKGRVKDKIRYLQALSHIGEEAEALEVEITKLLDHSHEEIRREALHILFQFKSLTTRDQQKVAANLDHSSVKVQRSALSVMRKLVSPTSAHMEKVEKIWKKSEDGPLRLLAAYTLLTWGKEKDQTFSYILSKSRKGTTKIRARALLYLGKWGKATSEVIKSLSQALDSKETKILDYTAHALFCLGEKATPLLPKIIEKLKAKSHLRKTIALFLHKLGKKVIDPLLPLLGHKDRTLRYEVRSVLSRLGEPAIPALIKVVKGGQGKGAEEAANALAFMNTTSRKYGDDIYGILIKSKNYTVRYACFSYFRSMKNNGLDYLIKAFVSNNFSVSYQAGSILGRRKFRSQSIPLLIDLLGKHGARLDRRIGRLFKKMGPDIISLLVSALPSEKDPAARAQIGSTLIDLAAKSLDYDEKERVYKAVIDRLKKDKKAKVRKEIAIALAKLKWKKEMLIEVLEKVEKNDPSRRVQMAARSSLYRLKK